MNVFVLLADSFRADHLGCYGNDWIRTPNLDRFAAEATRFAWAYSENMPTLPTRQTLFTGRYCLPFRPWRPLDMKAPVLAEMLWDRGVRTCMVTDTYHMHKPGMLYSRGFEEVHFIRGQESDPMLAHPAAIDVDIDRHFKDDGTPQGEATRKQTINLLRNRAHWQSDEDHYVAQCVKEGLGWLERQAAKGRKDGLFLWLDSFDPHEPWDPMPPFDALYGAPEVDGRRIINPIPRPVAGYLSEEECAHIRAQYAGLCTVVDKWLGIFLDHLREGDYLENSVIVFLSDHGEPLGNGHWGHGIVRKCRPWPYEELSHIPLMVRHPEHGQGRTVEGFVQTCDVTPTLLDALGVEAPSGMHGMSLLPLVRGESDTIRDFALSGYHRASWSYRTKDWTYILWRPEVDRSRIPEQSLGAIQCVGGGTLEMPGVAQLFRRSEDLYEQRNLRGEHLDVANDLEVRLRSFVERLVWEE
jgi:arylsulfatase A-like enzyme